MNKTIITIFGSTGDLALRKLLPALSNIINEAKDNEDITILAVGRRKYKNEDYLNFIAQSDAFGGDLDTLRANLLYVEVDVENPTSYENLKMMLNVISRGATTLREIFYLAVGPALFLPIAHTLRALNIVKKGNKNQIVAFEKPFGHTFSDAEIINVELERLFSKDQIYRIDHYLGKEIIQNILSLRFANPITQAIWTNKQIEEVKIVVSEKDGILNRGAYYDEVGVLNDMVQSHLFQILAILVMDKPKSLQSRDLQIAKIRALKKVRYEADTSFLGQYVGYQGEKGVDPQSMISTLAFLTFYVDNPTFRGIPFYLYTGKKLARKEAYIEIIFKDNVDRNIFNNVNTNRLVIEMAPFSRYVLKLNARKEGHSNELEPIEMEHCFNCVFPSPVKEAYVHLFREMMAGRSEVFPSWKEIQLSWEIIGQIRANKPRHLIYEPGFDIYGGEE